MKKVLAQFCLIIFSSFFLSSAFAQPVVTIGPELGFVRVGDMSVTSLPASTPMTVSIDAIIGADIFIAISSSDPGALTVTGGGVTIPAGSLSAVVFLSGNTQSPSVTLTASLGPQQVTSNIRVVGLAEVPKLVAISPATNTLMPGGTLTLYAELDIPSYGAATSIDLSVSPVNAGAIPVSVSVPVNEVSAAFTYEDNSTASSCDVTGDDGTYQASANIDLTTTGSLSYTMKSVSVYPNPFTDQLTLTVSDDQTSTLVLYNIYSQEVLRKAFSSSSSVSTSGFAPGIYMYELMDGNGKMSTGRIIKE